MRDYDRFNPFGEVTYQQPHVGFVKRAFSIGFTTGKKWIVELRDGSRFYTWDDLEGQCLASLCDAAGKQIQGVALTWRKTDYGHQITSVEYLHEDHRRVS